MHETSVAMALYRACRQEIEARGGGRLAEVRIAVGELAGVDPELLRLAWPAVVADGPDRACGLQVEWRPAAQTCASCGPVAERQPGTWLRLCPSCSGPLAVSDASDLDIVGIEFAVEAPASVG